MVFQNAMNDTKNGNGINVFSKVKYSIGRTIVKQNLTQESLMRLIMVRLSFFIDKTR